MSEKTKEVPLLADTTYAHTLVIKSTNEYKVHRPYGSDFPWKGCVGKLGHLFGFLRHYLLKISSSTHNLIIQYLWQIVVETSMWPPSIKHNKLQTFQILTLTTWIVAGFSIYQTEMSSHLSYLTPLIQSLTTTSSNFLQVTPIFTLIA